MDFTIIQTRIYQIRDQKVMLDFDLAALYEVETKRLKEAVRRNKKRFPPDFMFEISKAEYDSLRTQFASLEKKGKGQHFKYLPFAFTEHGVTMLASILNSDRAIEMNIYIVRGFIALRQIALEHKDIAMQLNELRQELSARIGKHDARLNAIDGVIDSLIKEKTIKRSWQERERIGFKK